MKYFLVLSLVLLSMPVQADSTVGPFKDAVFWNSNLGCLSEAENGECIVAECKKVPCISNNIGAKECGICDPVTIQKGDTGALTIGEEIGRMFRESAYKKIECTRHKEGNLCVFEK